MPSLVPPSSSQTVQPADPLIEYATFLHPTFDANQFAHSIVNNEPYPPPTTGSSNSVGAGMTPTAASTTHAANTVATGTAATGIVTTGTGYNNKGFMGNSGGDVSAALAKLNFGVEELSRQLKSEITKHHSSLLLQAASLGGIESDLSEVRQKLAQVEGGVTNLSKKITVPHTSLASSLSLLTRLRRASSLARRASRFTVLARRLEGQMNEIERALTAEADLKRESVRTVHGVNQSSSVDGLSVTGGQRIREREREEKRERRERAMAEAALTLAEIETLLKEPPASPVEETTTNEDPEVHLSIKSLAAVNAHVPQVQRSRLRVTEEMEEMVQRGLTELDQPLLASSLQTAHNLSVLPSLVDALVSSLTDLVSRRLKAVFDMSSLAREIGSKDTSSTPSQLAAAAFVYKSRTRNEPTTATMPQWTAKLWERLENCIAEMGDICIKVYALEKVLKLKRDQTTQIVFLDEAMTVLDNKPSLMFWTTLSQALETYAKESVKSSPFIQTVFSTGYTRLLRLFHEFFSRIAVHTDTVYSQNQQSPETSLILRAVGPFETLYLTRSSTRLMEAVSSAFSISSSLSASFSSRPPSMPTANEGLGIGRAIVNELDAARFDPLLTKSVARGASRAVEVYVQKSGGLIAHDHSATSLLGPLATPSQHSNADLASSLYHLWSPLNRALNDHTDAVRVILKPATDAARATYLAISNPLIMAIRRDFSSIIARMHRVDYGASGPTSGGAGGASNYMVDLTDKLTLVREEILGAYRVGDLAKEWALDLARFTVQTFILHASIVRQLGESGKLKLTSDTTALEFAISQFLASHNLSLASMGDQFKALRAFRPLLFLDDAQLAQPEHTTDVPSLILLHHILSRAKSLVLPNQLPRIGTGTGTGTGNGMSEAEYVRWLNEHGEKERLGAIDQVVAWYEARRQDGEVVDDGDDGERMMTLLRIVLERSRRGLEKQKDKGKGNAAGE